MKNINFELKNKLIFIAFLIRETENQLLNLFSEGKISGTIHTCIGQEFVGTSICTQLKLGDSVFSNHRCHGHYIAHTQDIEGLIAEICGRETGVCAGRGGSQHLCHEKGFFSNGIQGGIVPIAAGIAAAKKQQGKPNISVVFIGDGTLGEGVLYESLNIISKWQLPILIILENNYYAQSTHQNEVLSGNIFLRAQAFDILTKQATTYDWESLYVIAGDLIRECREQSKPAFLIVDTYRLNAHSKGDDIRDPLEVKSKEEADPLNIIQQTEEGKIIQQKAKEIVEQITNRVLNIPEASYQYQVISPLKFNQALTPMPIEKIRLSKAINQAFVKLMNANDKIYFIGEDVKSPYGGAFKISNGLSNLFPNRVFNTPISEAAIVGIGTGMAIEGYIPIIEIMFGDFITLAMDQILNHASKFKYMYNNKINVPLIIRTPMGAGRGYGATHSQTLDKHFMGIPGLRMMALNNLIDPYCFYESIINTSKDPTIVIENKLSYGSMLRINPPIGYRFIYHLDEFASIATIPMTVKAKITVIAYGGLVEITLNVIEKLFTEYEIIAQCIFPLQIYPFSINQFREYFVNCDYVFILEEGQGFAGFGAEVSAQLAESNVNDSSLRIKRLFPLSTPIPSSRILEKAMMLDENSIVNSVINFINESAAC